MMEQEGSSRQSEESNENPTKENPSKFRLLLTDHSSGAMNMAIDEAVLTHISEGKSPPTIRFYGWTPPSVTIGYFQSMKEEIEVEKCKKEKIDLIRRVTGGGAVFHDNEVTYSIITPENLFSKDILESYRQICQGIINGLKKIGLDTNFVPLNDIILNNKKISGNAQTRKMKCILQHGTILVDVDVKKMFSLLLIPNEKIKDKMIQVVEERVTSINQEAKKDEKEYTFDDIVRILAQGFEESLNTKLELSELSESEKEMAEKLAKEKYSTDEWNFKR